MSRCRHLVALLGAATLAYGASVGVAYRIETIAGNDRMGDGGPALAAQFGTLQGIAADRFGNVFVADTDYHRIRKIAASGVVSTYAGTGTPGYGGDGGPASSAQLNLPYGLAVDAAGYLFIADLGNNRVRRVTPGGIITTAAGSGLKGSRGDEGPAVDAQLMSPRNLAVDGNGNLYIAEFEGHRVRRVAPDGRISTIAGTGVAGFSGDGLTARNAQIGFPAGLAADRSGAILVCDSQNSRVRKIVPGGIITTVLGGAPGTALLTPTALAVDSSGTIYVGDRSSSVRQYSAAGAWSTTAGTGEIGYAGDGGPAPQARLTAVRDLAADPLGALLVADSTRLRRVNQGIITTVAGDGYLRYIGDNAAASSATLLQPTGLAVDAARNIFIADAGMHRVRRIGSNNAQIVTVAGTGVAGYSDSQVLATTAQLDTPYGVAATFQGELLIADTNNQRIRKVGSDNKIKTVAGTGAAGTGPEGVAGDKAPLRAPRNACVDRTGTIFVVDTANHRILRLGPGGQVATAAGNGAPGDAGDTGIAPLAQLNSPAACAVDAAGNLYIADTGNHRIRKVDAGGVIATVAGTGTAGFAGDGGPAPDARLYAPRGVAVDTAGALYIADTGNHRVRRVDVDGSISTLAGRDLPGFSGDGGPAADAQVFAPQSVAVDSAGTIYVADTGNARIRKIVGEALPPEPVVLPPQISTANAASLVTGPIAPGELVVITGTGLAPETGISASPDAGGLLQNRIAGAEVLFDGVPAPLLYVQASQIIAQAPYPLAGRKVTTIEARYQGQSRGVTTVPVAEASPALFAGPQNADSTLNSAGSPAARGSVVTFLATGEGLTDGPNLSGLPAAPPYPKPQMPVSLRIAGFETELLGVGAAPGLVGVLQIEARVPAGFIPPGEAPVVFAVGTYVAPAFSLWLK